MEQLSLFTQTELKNLEPGSKQWRVNKYNELKQLTYDELEQLEHEIYERYEINNKWYDENDYYTSSIIIDILHYDKMDEFKKREPNCPASWYDPQKPYYL